MERNGNSDGASLQPLLHDLVAASLAYRGKSVLCQNATDFGARKDAQLTQPVPQPESQKPLG